MKEQDEEGEVQQESQRTEVRTFSEEEMVEQRKLGLSKQEATLCSSLQLPLSTYHTLKSALLKEATEKGFIDNNTQNLLAKIDVKLEREQGKKVVEFILRSGWVRVKSR